MVYYQFTTTSSTKSNRSGEFKILTYHTEPSNSFECPFCKLSSLFSESSLLNHLTHSHPRFAAQLNSKGNPTNGEPIRIELVIDPLYDASYASKHQHTLFGYPQVCFYLTKKYYYSLECVFKNNPFLEFARTATAHRLHD